MKKKTHLVFAAMTFAALTARHQSEGSKRTSGIDLANRIQLFRLVRTFSVMLVEDGTTHIR